MDGALSILPYKSSVVLLCLGVEETETEGGCSDVQKKIIPWKAMLPELTDDLGDLEVRCKKQHHPGGLVLVTSLINKKPNLGG